ncbi:MAG: OmpA family protein, partial [Hyphomonadaceae bacterium]|nr:OmpA family protein [Hyphomonadaceae bacterium]
MKLQNFTAVAAALLLGVPSQAYADDHGEGWYLRGNVGYGAHTDMDIAGDLVGSVQSEGNVAVSLGVGYDLGNNWRIELDGTTLWTDLGVISANPGAASDGSATYAGMRTNTLMVNGLYDFDDFDDWAPYIGAGLGIVQGDPSAVAQDAISNGAFFENPACSAVGTRAMSTACSVFDTSTSISWQLIAGLGYNMTDRLVWDTQYRYQNFGDLDFDSTSRRYSSADALTVTEGGTSFEGAGAHIIMTGFRYRFGAKAPMVACWDGSREKNLASCPERLPEMQTCWDGSEILASATCPAKPPRMQTCWDGSEVPVTSTCPPQRQSFTCTDGTVVFDSLDNCPVVLACPDTSRQEIIYYEFASGNSAETAPTISRILDVDEYCRIEGVRVVGHTDTVGSAAYNLRLSRDRAEDARSELVRQGVDSAIVISEGKGETEPFVPTGDGVREQLNRRTEVVLTLG